MSAADTIRRLRELESKAHLAHRDPTPDMVRARNEYMLALLIDAPAVLDALEAAEREAAKGCAVVHVDHPEGYSCLDREYHAANTRHAYEEAFRASIIAGERRCFRCDLRACLSALDKEAGR